MASINSAVMYAFNVSDPGDSFTVRVAGQPPPADEFNITRADPNDTLHILHWTPRNASTTVRLQIEANDTRGATSILHPLVVLCGCQNGHSCASVPDGEDGGDDRFISPSCNCGEGKCTLSSSLSIPQTVCSLISLQNVLIQGVRLL